MALDPSNPRRQGMGQKIDRLQEELYSRGAPEIKEVKRPPLSAHASQSAHGESVSQSWKEEEATVENLAPQAKEPRRVSIFTKIFLAAVFFFVVAAGIAAYVLIGGFNVISSKNVDITVEGLIAVAAGEELVLDITVSNGNNVALEQMDLFVEYPEGTRVPGDITKELTREKISLETIPAGGTVKKVAKAVLFGEKDSVKQIKITADYKARGSNASFSKEKTYDIAIKSSPILAEVSYPSEVNAGQEINFNVSITSNSATPLRDLLLQVDYPFGFSFTDATPKAAFDNKIWQIGELGPEQKRTFVIKGKIEGQNEEERTFRFHTGIAKTNDENQIGVGFISQAYTILIKKPFITLSVKLNQNIDKDYSIKIGERVSGQVSWVNNLPINLSDAKVEVKFSGAALDRSRVNVGQGGFYRSIDNIIVWDKNSVSALQNIAPGDGNSLDFDFFSVPSSQTLIAQGRNLKIGLDVSVKGTRISESGAPQAVSSSFSREVKIETNLGLSARTLYSIGPFQNSGPVPPRAEKKTSYTVVWTLSNTFNDVAGASVVATLPPYVKWLGVVSPVGADISYNDGNRAVVWNVGEVKAGSGFVSTAREVAFQISLEPSLSQVGTTPDLVQNIEVRGTDRFTLKALSEAKSALTTKTSTDPSYNHGDETVVK